MLASDDRGGYELEAASVERNLAPATAFPSRERGAATTPAVPSTDRLTALADELGALLAVPAAVLDECSTDTLRTRVRVLRRLEGMTAAAMADVVGALARTGAVAEDGASSTAAWVAQETGCSRRQASRTVRMSSSLDDVPLTKAALANGEIALETADAIVQSARDGRLGSPGEVERLLLPLATAGPERLRAHVRRLTQEVDAAAMLGDEQRQRQQRRVSLNQLDDGMWALHGMLTAEVGTRFRTLLNAVDERDPTDTPQDARRRPEQRLADALEVLVNIGLDLGPLPEVGGVSRPHLSVIVDVATFDTDLTDPDQPDRPISPADDLWAGLRGAETEWASTLSPQAARKLCCDAGISRVVMAGTSQVLDVGRETRTWSPPQRRAVNARDRCCRGPRCNRPIAWTQIHHLQWWERDGPTSVDNGIALCCRCHDLIHHGGWHAELDVTTAAVTWTSPDRRRTVVTHPRPAA